ncbi:unnamed protein product, partial [Lepidochelys olivacea]
MGGSLSHNACAGPRGPCVAPIISPTRTSASSRRPCMRETGGTSASQVMGPAKQLPQIKHHPQDQVNVSGHDVIFMVEVFAYPMALVERRKGEEFALPGDDPHISIQSRGGPLKYELSSWLQIEGMRKADGGTYSALHTTSWASHCQSCSSCRQC